MPEPGPMMARVEGALRSLLIHRNPLVIKGARARLRLRAALATALVTLTLTGWVFLMAYSSMEHLGEADAGEAARSAFVPVLMIQAFVLIFLGTGSVAYGISEEKERGVLDYQRLTPMAPRDKILGYLFGLPSREYFAFALTLPFTLFCAAVGEVGLGSLVKLYVVFLSSAMLYHMTGLVAGMVSRHPRRASWLARGMVIALYLVLPQVAQMGFTVFSYLTFFPTFNAVLGETLGTVGGGFGQRSVMPLFNVRLSPVVFTLLLQGLLLAMFFTIMKRKWRHDSSPALGRRGALIYAGLIQVLVIGSLWPLIADPALLQKFPAFAMAPNSEILINQYLGAALLVFSYLVGLTGAVWLHIVTPDPDELREGLRRARKRGRQRPSPWSDRASSLWVALALGAMASVGAAVLLALARRSERFHLLDADLLTAAWPMVALTCHLIIVQSARTLWGTRGVLAVGFALWLVPVLGSMLWAVALDAERLAFYTAAFSPEGALFFTTLNLFGSEAHLALSGETSGLVATSLLVAVSLAVIGVLLQRRQGARLRAQVFGDAPPGGLDSARRQTHSSL